jgi:hypothetical protein
MSEEDKVSHPRDDDRNEEVAESPVPDPEGDHSAETDDPEAD